MAARQGRDQVDIRSGAVTAIGQTDRRRGHRERSLIERFCSKLKHVRRVAARYDKLAVNFPG
jgi:hypothetical protein